MREQRGLRRDLEALGRRVSNHETAVLRKRDQLLIRPDERRLLDAAFLPKNLAARNVDGTQDGLTALASAREVNRVADANRVAVVKSQPIGIPDFRGARL